MSQTLTPPDLEVVRGDTPASAPPPVARMPREQKRIPGLDGMRAFSILLVIAWHLRSSGSAPWLDPLWRIDTGNLGVRVFFVISGYLITSVLLSEHARTGTIDLRRFYIRRAFRIMPVFYVFLAVIALAAGLGIVEASRTSLLDAATYIADYTKPQWTVGHTWSLAVEEQFYLLWPGMIVLLGVRRSFIGAAIVLLLSPGIRAAAFLGHWPNDPRHSFDVVADALATGCLFAYARSWLWSHALYRRVLASRAAAMLPVAIIAIAAANVRWPLLGAIAGITMLNLSIAVTMDWCLRFPNTLSGRILNARPVAFIGVLSYSIYLWQQPFLRPTNPMPFPYSILCIGALSLASYYAVEKPFLRLRARLEPARK